jgi:predicted nuclease of predicted toxin-antitoxin system
MNILIDMNLSPEWVEAFEKYGWHAAHWSEIGDPRVPDYIIMDWARSNGYIVFTHDLDFGTLLADTQAESLSVIQVRTQDTLPSSLENLIAEVLKEYESVLEAGALITVEHARSRMRVLPINR